MNAHDDRNTRRTRLSDALEDGLPAVEQEEAMSGTCATCGHGLCVCDDVVAKVEAALAEWNKDPYACGVGNHVKSCNETVRSWLRALLARVKALTAERDTEISVALIEQTSRIEMTKDRDHYKAETDALQTRLVEVIRERDNAHADLDDCATTLDRMIQVAGNALGTDPEMRSPGCVDALVVWTKDIASERDELLKDVAVLKAQHVSAEEWRAAFQLEHLHRKRLEANLAEAAIARGFDDWDRAELIAEIIRMREATNEITRLRAKLAEAEAALTKAKTWVGMTAQIHADGETGEVTREAAGQQLCVAITKLLHTFAALGHLPDESVRFAHETIAAWKAKP
jgi:hypothetical protein